MPILVLSAHALAADVAAGLAVGADDDLLKPYAMAELLARAAIPPTRSAADDQ